ncbi:MAG: tetratricopeptide repeat protein [Deltaproteobacteria bacterium]|nr:tetratricopeptide repeat protein [Deltaproteobacteria bacterium]
MAKTVSFHKSTLAACLALVALVLAAHGPSLSNGFIWDDDSYLYKNPLVLNPGGLSDIWLSPTASPQYYPLVFTTFWVEYRLWGLNPAAFHVVNVLLHALCATLAFLILRRVNAPGAFLAAALFAVHPVQVETVAWVAERKNLLSGVFSLGAALCLLDRFGAGPDEPERSRGWFALATLLFVLALFSKTVAATLAVGAGFVLWYAKGEIRPRQARGLAGWAVLGLVFGLLTLWMEKTHVGAAGPAWSLSMLQRVILAGRALFFYAQKLCWPHPLVFIYPRFTPDPGNALHYLYPVGAAAALVLTWIWRDRLGRGPFAALAWFTATLFPALGFFDVYPFLYATFADHFQYLASLGLFALAAGAATLAWRRWVSPRAPRLAPVAGVALATAALALLCGASWSRNADFTDFETLWVRTLEKNPEAWIAYGNLARICESRGDREKAMEYRRKVVELAPAVAQGHYNLGAMLIREGRFGEGVLHLYRAAELEDNTVYLHALGMALAAAGRPTEALVPFARAVQKAPGLPEPLYGLGLTFYQTGDYAQAADLFQQALGAMETPPKGREQGKNHPDFLLHGGDHPSGFANGEPGTEEEEGAEYQQYLFAEIHRYLGKSLLAMDRGQDAAGHLGKALDLLPGDPTITYELALALAAAGEREKAVERFQEVLETNPGHRGALNDLGVTLLHMGHFRQAVDVFSRAVKAGPDNPAAHKHLAQALCLAGEGAKAQKALERLRALDPDAARRTSRWMETECGP